MRLKGADAMREAWQQDGVDVLDPSRRGGATELEPVVAPERAEQQCAESNINTSTAGYPHT